MWWLFLQWSMGGDRAPNQNEIYYFLIEAYLRNYFLHFAGAANPMPVLQFIGA